MIIWKRASLAKETGLLDLINKKLLANNFDNYFCVNPAEYKVIPCEKAQKSTYHFITFPKFIVFWKAIPNNFEVWLHADEAAISIDK